MSLGNHVTGENSNEESINSALGLDSIVQDSQSPLIDECLESVNNSSQFQYAEARVGDNQKQEKNGGIGDNNSVQCDSNICVRASQGRAKRPIECVANTVRLVFIAAEFDLNDETPSISGSTTALFCL
ncbi:hypothetical protein RHGRI_025867 [Rhododendron griersonianum]|uniref:Uncharacterized protein n=1 Tax=Rhododendron griersonianum TaxID=479676 RepID=A0AAV6IRJ1_9ERIC|nr:hypothetical protein RHGRI_025867 [Rhododendron griersonianum]